MLTKRQVRTLRVLLRQHGIEGGLTKALELWMAIHWVVVPWCAEHDSPMKDDVCDWVWGNKYDVLKKPCRLEEPAHHYVIGEAE